MTINADILKNLVERELRHISDARVLLHIRALLVEPKPILRNWDYGKRGQQFPCWIVLVHALSNTAIAYCESGFGPRNPWGLLWFGTHEPKHDSMGMDSGWFPTFLDACFESFPATELPIWRVFRTNASGVREPLTDEGAWDTTWSRIAELRKEDPASRYDCEHSITYQSLKWDDSEHD